MKSFRDLGGGKALCRCISFHERCSAQEDAFRLNRLTALPKAALSNLLENINQSMLFADCVFHLVGFDENDTPTATTTTTTTQKVQLSRLIRRGTGTIYWDMNESVTHIVVNDGCEDVLR